MLGRRIEALERNVAMLKERLGPPQAVEDVKPRHGIDAATLIEPKPVPRHLRWLLSHDGPRPQVKELLDPLPGPPDKGKS
jgi:hypothetical protein